MSTRLILVDQTGPIDRAKQPDVWAQTLACYLDACAECGRLARIGEVERAKYLGRAAAVLHSRLW